VRVAALYDVHGHLPALEAALAEAERAGVDAVLCGGDVSAGPMPVECVDRLREAGAAFVRGNADRDLGGWAAEQMSSDRLEFLASLPTTATLGIDGLGEVMFCHSTPSSDEIYFLETTQDHRALEILGDVHEPVVVCGHTHMQFDRRIGPTRVVNAGSVGMPYEGKRGAFWALLDGEEVDLRHTPYPVEAAVAAIRGSGYPGVDQTAGMLLDPEDPAHLSRRDDLQSLEVRTVHVAIRG